MPKLAENAVPSYRLHKQSGQAIVTLNGQDITLGRYGTRASRDRYNQIIGEWLAAGRRLPEKVAAITIAEVVNAYRKHADVYYRHADGTPTSSIERLARELSPLAKLYARLPAAELSPLKVKAVRDSMIKLGWSRGSINHAVGTIKRLVKWAVENELIPPAVHHGVAALEGLKQGRSPAKESEPVRPVPAAHLKTIPPLLSRQVRAMVELQAVSAMRPGEVCAMRTGEIDRSGKLWVYRPRQHKTQHHGHAREVYLGPKAQEILTPFLKLDPGAYLFSPAEAEAERRRQTDRARRGRRKPGACYSVASYRRAIARAGAGTVEPPPHLARLRVTANGRKKKSARWETHREWRQRLGPERWREWLDWQREQRFAPSQLRHTAATELRKTHGLEAAQVILGHKTLTVTQVYAERNVQQAMKIMAAVG